nr:hypothetical protein [uncultured bacterium]
MAKRNKQEQKPADREAIAAAFAASMPADRDELLTLAVAAVVEVDAAIMRGDGAAAELAADKYAAVIWKMNGGTHVGSMVDDDAPGRVVERHCAAVPGEVPLWGQRGQFLVEREGVRALVEYEAGYGGPLGAHFQFYALDLDKPFISETGYRSNFATAQGCMTVDEVAGGILAAMLAEKKRPVMIQDSYRDRLAGDALPSWCAALMPPARREPATVTVPAGFVLVDVVLPKQKAFIVRKWAEAAKARVEAARSAGLNAKKKGGGRERDPASSKPTMSCSTVKNGDEQPQPAAYWAGFKTGDRIQTKSGTTGVFVLGDDKFIGYLVPDKLAGGVPNPDAGKATLRAHKFSVTPNEVEHIQEPARASIARNDDAEAVPFAPGMRCEVSSVHHPCLSRDIGKRVVITKVNLEFRSVWAHEDKPVTYRTNRNGRRVVDHDPRCIESVYGFEQLHILT